MFVLIITTFFEDNQISTSTFNIAFLLMDGRMGTYLFIRRKACCYLETKMKNQKIKLQTVYKNVCSYINSIKNDKGENNVQLKARVFDMIEVLYY